MQARWKQPPGYDLLLRARRLMDRDYAEPLDIQRLAAASGYSPHHFIREYSRTFKETPHRYLMRRRMERAKEPSADRGNPGDAGLPRSGIPKPGGVQRRFFALRWALAGGVSRGAGTREPAAGDDPCLLSHGVWA